MLGQRGPRRPVIGSCEDMWERNMPCSRLIHAEADAAEEEEQRDN